MARRTEPAATATDPHEAARIDPATLPGRPCSIAAALDVVGDRWSLLIVREVMFGNGRFTQLVRNTGAPRDRIAARLRTLVDAGVLERHAYQDSPRREEYRLTQAGRELGSVTSALLAWGDKWAVSTPPMRQTHHDHAFTPSVHCAECGEPVTRSDIVREVVADGWDLRGPLDDADDARS
ncbi:helix-turn-helix domain-containing protein [Rugosimonospora acidiphila]|uniref:Helix-turn-helix domain-containing protein n=1 Tax=Rugosimonospora acidiphila TaxID=556531 RepID=A0ABP9SSB2_9ACTN